MLMEQRSPNRTHHETFLVLEEKVVALWAGIALEELFRVPVVEASVVLLLDLCALFADAWWHGCFLCCESKWVDVYGWVNLIGTMGPCEPEKERKNWWLRHACQVSHFFSPHGLAWCYPLSQHSRQVLASSFVRSSTTLQRRLNGWNMDQYTAFSAVLARGRFYEIWGATGRPLACMCPEWRSQMLSKQPAKEEEDLASVECVWVASSRRSRLQLPTVSEPGLCSLVSTFGCFSCHPGHLPAHPPDQSALSARLACFCLFDLVCDNQWGIVNLWGGVGLPLRFTSFSSSSPLGFFCLSLPPCLPFPLPSLLPPSSLLHSNSLIFEFLSFPFILCSVSRPF